MILLVLQKQEFCFWIFFLSSYNHFLSHDDHLHSIVNFYKPFHLHPRNIVLPQIADTFKKLPKVTLKNPPFRSAHIDLTFAQLFFSRPKSLRQINTKRKKANANQSVCNIFGGEYNCISLSFQRKKCFLRWNEEWSQRNDEWQEHLEKPHCCKEKKRQYLCSELLPSFVMLLCPIQSSQTFRAEVCNNNLFEHRIWC